MVLLLLPQPYESALMTTTMGTPVFMAACLSSHEDCYKLPSVAPGCCCCCCRSRMSLR